MFLWRGSVFLSVAISRRAFGMLSLVSLFPTVYWACVADASITDLGTNLLLHHGEPRVAPNSADNRRDTFSIISGTDVPCGNYGFENGPLQYFALHCVCSLIHLFVLMLCCYVMLTIYQHSYTWCPIRRRTLGIVIRTCFSGIRLLVSTKNFNERLAWMAAELPRLLSAK